MSISGQQKKRVSSANNSNWLQRIPQSEVYERLLLSKKLTRVKHRFDDKDENGNVICKFQCITHWALQFEAIRYAYFKRQKMQSAEGHPDVNVHEEYHYDDFAKSFLSATEDYVQSLSLSARWQAQGGKSGAFFSKSLDGRFVCKVISKIELDMFINFAPAYFEYMTNAYYHDLPTVLCKILGVYTISYEVEGSKRVSQNVVVMENIFHDRTITKIFDLKGSSRARYTTIKGTNQLEKFDEALLKRRRAVWSGKECEKVPVPYTSQVLLDDNLLELTDGRPFPLKHRAKIYFDKAVGNDTEFLSMVNVVDYSILVGFDENNHEICVGIIDYMRQYDFLKKMERLGKSVGMMTGQAEPTIIQPQQYSRRFNLAMEKYFMAVPDKWSFSEIPRSRKDRNAAQKESELQQAASQQAPAI